MPITWEAIESVHGTVSPEPALVSRRPKDGTVGRAVDRRTGEHVMADREEGRIVSWSDSAGLGVIRRTDGSEVVFSFADVRQHPGAYVGLSNGLRVSFVVVSTEAGLRARDVA